VTEPGDAPAPGTSRRTAVVVVHGLLEWRPLENFDRIAKTILTPGRPYFPRPPEVTDSYEARRYYVEGADGSGDVELFEYHWSYLMTSGRYAGLAPTMMRVFLRRPANVPDPLYGVWRATWLALLTPVVLAVVVLGLGGYYLSIGVPAWLVGLVSSVLVLAIGLGAFRIMSTALTRTFFTVGFVDVARYLDPLPESYAARRAIRAGLVDLLYTLQQGHFARVVVIGHGLGGFVAYDALTALWAETHELHAGPLQEPTSLAGLTDLETAAEMTSDPAGLDEYQARQFELWQHLRMQGNPWRITDFVTIGTPMALADMLLTRPPVAAGLKPTDARHGLFDGLLGRGVLATCPPRSERTPVDGTTEGRPRYGWCSGGGRELLGPQSAFAVTRWTNLWFPVKRGGVRGDWFGGPLRPLFGVGIRDVVVEGNLPARRAPGAAHVAYFRHPDADAPGDVAWHLRSILALDSEVVPAEVLTAPVTDPDTVERVVHRSWQRSS
jgi:hypothetical protein